MAFCKAAQAQIEAAGLGGGGDKLVAASVFYGSGGAPSESAAYVGLPLVPTLADYFAGVEDAEYVLQQVPETDNFEIMMTGAGVQGHYVSPAYWVRAGLNFGADEEESIINVVVETAYAEGAARVMVMLYKAG